MNAPSGSLCLPRSLGHEGQETARVVDHDAAKNLIAGARGLQFRHEHSECLGVALYAIAFRLRRARDVRGEHQVLSEAGVDEGHDHWHLLRVSRPALAVEADERA